MGYARIPVSWINGGEISKPAKSVFAPQSKSFLLGLPALLQLFSSMDETTSRDSKFIKATSRPAVGEVILQSSIPMDDGRPA